MSRTFTPSPAYRLFLFKLVEARIARGHSLEQFAETTGLTTQQVVAFEAGTHPLSFIDVRVWLLALL
jgi:transcriptional regulator with XRE-family HTH domain